MIINHLQSERQNLNKLLNPLLNKIMNFNKKRSFQKLIIKSKTTITIYHQFSRKLFYSKTQ